MACKKPAPYTLCVQSFCFMEQQEKGHFSCGSLASTSTRALLIDHFGLIHLFILLRHLFLLTF